MTIALSSQENDRRQAVLLGLSREDAAERRSYLGASDANTIAGDDGERLTALWRYKTGLDEAEDLSDNLAVQMGIWTEALNIRWLERKTGLRVVDRQARKPHPKYDFIVARVEGLTDLDGGRRATVEVKHCGPFNFDMDAIVARYSPQLSIQMTAHGVDQAVLSVFSGSNKWEHRIVEYDPFYAARVALKMEEFWASVQAKEPLAHFAPLAPPIPVPQALMRKVDMGLNNAWSAAEADYLAHEAEATAFDEAAKTLRSLVEPDVKEAFGRRLVLRRDKRNALRVYKAKGDKA